MRSTPKRDPRGHVNAGSPVVGSAVTGSRNGFSLFSLLPFMKKPSDRLSRREWFSSWKSLGIGAGVFAATSQVGEAQSIFRRRGDLNSLQRSQQRALYRPRVRIVRPSGGSKTFRVGQSFPYTFYAKRGFVTRIEVRSGIKVIKRVEVGKARSGRGSITITNRDLAAAGKAGKKIGFTIWAWQGQPSYQSVHGESVRYQLLP